MIILAWRCNLYLPCGHISVSHDAASLNDETHVVKDTVIPKPFFCTGSTGWLPLSPTASPPSGALLILRDSLYFCDGPP